MYSCMASGRSATALTQGSECEAEIPCQDAQILRGRLEAMIHWLLLQKQRGRLMETVFSVWTDLAAHHTAKSTAKQHAQHFWGYSTMSAWFQAWKQRCISQAITAEQSFMAEQKWRHRVLSRAIQAWQAASRLAISKAAMAECKADQIVLCQI